MTIRERLKFRYRLMVAGVLMIPASGSLWLHSSTPLDHTFRIAVIAGADIAVMFLFMATFRCPTCRNSLSAVSREILFESDVRDCPRCGTHFD